MTTSAVARGDACSRFAGGASRHQKGLALNDQERTLPFASPASVIPLSPQASVLVMPVESVFLAALASKMSGPASSLRYAGMPSSKLMDWLSALARSRDFCTHRHCFSLISQPYWRTDTSITADNLPMTRSRKGSARRRPVRAAQGRSRRAATMSATRRWAGRSSSAK